MGTPNHGSRLAEFGFGELELAASDFQTEGQVVQLGVPPVRVAIITSIDGVSWEQGDKGKASGTYGEVPVNYLGRDEFIANKRACGRKQDLADIEALEDA